jgi:hypothetical protein
MPAGDKLRLGKTSPFVGSAFAVAIGGKADMTFCGAHVC